MDDPQTRDRSGDRNPWQPGDMAQIASGLPNPLKFRWGFWHIFKFSAVFQLSSWILQILFFGLSLLIATSTIRDGNRPGTALNYFVSLIVAVILYLVMWGAQLLFNAIMLYKRRDRHLNLDCSLEVLESGLRFRTPLADCLYSWSGILKVTVRMGMMMIYVGPRSSILIPFEYFPSDSARDELVKIIETRIKEYKSAA